MPVRKFSSFIYMSICGCALSIIICSVALGTEQWYHGITKRQFNSTITNVVEINHGLFQGNKVKIAFSDSKFRIFVFCLGSEGLCMFSCGDTSFQRERDIKYLLDNPGKDGIDTQICTGKPFESGKPEVEEADPDEDTTPKFLSFALWMTTLLFLAGAILFSLIGGILGLYNTYSAPFQPILSVFGLYVWNGIAASCILLTMILWGIAFATNLNQSAAVSETLSGNGNFSSKGVGSLGFSYWILLAAEFMNLGNIALLRYRTWKIADVETNNTRVMNPELTKGEILLY